MTREEIFQQSLEKIKRGNFLLLELATGTGKSKIAIDVINYLCKNKFQGKDTSLLILVDKKVHKITWEEEIMKWGGLSCKEITIECYKSLHKHCDHSYNFIIMDECHHIGSELRLGYLSTIKYGYMVGLSATIPNKLKKYLDFKYHSKIISCDITEAIESEVLPEPKILLFPMLLDATRVTETWEINAKSGGGLYKDSISNIWKYRRNKQHALLYCTRAQWLREINSVIEYRKKIYENNGNERTRNTWQYYCGKRLEFLANCKNEIVSLILQRLKDYRTITFCKTITQAEVLGKNCIHSKNAKAQELFEQFNSKKIKHITAVNILNENANLVDCKYAIFANISSSEVVITQRLGRAMRHKSPVIIVPYYMGTREEEIVKEMFKNYNRQYIKIIKSINEIQ